MTTNIGSLAVSLSLDASNFNGSMAQVDRNLRTMGSELKAAKALGADYGNSLDGLRSKKDILSRSVEASSIKLTEERKKYDELVASGKANEAQLERQAKKVNDAQANYNRLSTELSEVDKQLKIQSSSWTQYGEKMEAAGKKMQTIGKGMTDVGDNLTKKVSLPIAGMATAAFKAAVDFESAFAGVRKTVDMSETEFATLSDGIRNMAKEIPAAATEIAGVAEAAGQLGIKKEAILGFTRTMTDLGVATNMSSDEAATALARLANITSMNQKDFDRLGSSVVDLGNNFATTEKEIVDMALRLAGAGSQIGMSEADILGLSAALSSVGIEAEMGGSALSKAMIRMQVASTTGTGKMEEILNFAGMSLREMQLMASHSGKAFGNLAEDLGMTKKELSAILNAGTDLENFAKIAGMTGEEFSKAFEKDAVGALGAFINGLGNAEAAGDSAINMLEEMGISEVRLRDSLLRAGNASELFADSVNISNKAWDENNALTKEAEERYKTTASQMKILWNRITDIGISFGEILIPMAQEGMDKIGGLVDKFASLDTEQQKNIVKMAGLAAAIGPVLSVTGRLSTSFGSLLLIGGNLAKGIGGAGGLAASLGAIAGPGAIAVGALAAVTAGGYALYKVLNETSIPEIDIFGDTVSENTKKAVGAFTELTDEASIQLGLLKSSGMTVSEEMAVNMVGTFSQMGDTILSEMKEDHAAQLETVTKHLGDLKSLSKQEQDEILASVVEGHKTREERVENLQRQYNTIVERAANERRGLHAEEQSALDRIQSEMMETGISYLSETEREQKVILERIKSESEKISAEQAIEIAKRARETKEAVIEEAEKTYDEKVKTYLMLRDETKTISAEQYEALVKDAENTRDESIKATEGQYEEVIRITKDKGDTYVTETELRLGRVMTEWEKLSLNVGTETAMMSVKTISTIKQMMIDSGIHFTNLKNNAITSAKDLAKGYRIAVEVLPGAVKTVMIEAAAEAAKSAIHFYDAGKDAAQGIINGLKSKVADVGVEAGKLGLTMLKKFDLSIGRQSPAKEFIKSAEDVGRGIVVGLRNSEGLVSAASADLGKIMTSVHNKYVSELKLIDKQSEKERIAVLDEYAKKRIELERKTSQTIQSAMKTSVNKKGQLTVAGTQRIHNTRADAAIKLRKLEEDEQKKLAKISEKTLSDMQKQEAKINKERLDAIKLYVDDKKSLEELSLFAESEIWRKSIAIFSEGSKERIEAQKSLKKTTEAILKEEESIKKDYLSKVKDLNKEYIDEEKRLNDEYQKTLDDRVSKLYSFAGIFDEIAARDVSGDTLLRNLKAQVTAFEDWQKNITFLATKGIDDGLLAELREMGPKAGAEIAALNTLTDAQLTEYVSVWQVRNKQAREQAATELTELKKNTEKQVDQLRVKTAEQLRIYQNEWRNSMIALKGNVKAELNEMPSIGEFAVSGLIGGMLSKQGELMSAAQTLADIVSSTFQKALDIHSPSRKFDGFGVNINEGLIQGMRRTMSKVKVSMKDMYGGLAGSVQALITSGTSNLSNPDRSSAITENNFHMKFYSPKPIDPYEASRLARNSLKEASLQL